MHQFTIGMMYPKGRRCSQRYSKLLLGGIKKQQTTDMLALKIAWEKCMEMVNRIPKNDKIAFKWYQQAANLGDASCSKLI